MSDRDKFMKAMSDAEALTEAVAREGVEAMEAKIEGDFLRAKQKEQLPKVKCRLVGQDGNAYAILGRFQVAARKAKWPAEEIKKVMDEATSSDYNHLLATIMEHCENP